MVSRRASVLLDLTSLAIVAGVTLAEADLVSPPLKPWYIGGRIAIGAALLIHLALNRYNQKIWYGVAWALSLYLYTYLGEYCRPLYIISLFQIQVVHAVYFRHTKFSYAITNTLGTLTFVTVMFIAWPQNVIRLREAALGDQISIAFVSLASAMLVFVFLESERKKSALFTRKLALAGSYATSLIHDIKNLSAGPLLYSNMLADQKRQLTQDEFRDLIQSLNSDLQRISYVVKELYSASNTEPAAQADCSIREVCTVAQEIVLGNIKGIDVRITGDGHIRTDRKILQMIVLNLFYNATAALKTSSDRKIEIEITKRGFTFANTTTEETISSGGIGLVLMNELGRQANIEVTGRAIDGRWLTDVRFHSDWTGPKQILELS